MSFKRTFITIIAVVVLLLGIEASISVVNDSDAIICRWRVDKWNESQLLYWYPVDYVQVKEGSESHFVVAKRLCSGLLRHFDFHLLFPL